MTKIKVKINAPLPPIDTVRRYRDFDGLMEKFRKYYSTGGIRDMLYNDRKKLVYIVIIVLLLLLLLFVDDITQKPDDSSQQNTIEQINGTEGNTSLSD